MKNVCLIPARGGSKGIPGKNIRDFCGKPLIRWTIDQAICSGIFCDRIYVSTDDGIIMAEAEKCGAKTIKRPKNLSMDESPMVPVIQHSMVSILHENPSLEAENVFITLLQPTNPLRLKKDIQIVDRIAGVYKPDQNVVICSTYEGCHYKFSEYSPLGGHRRQDSSEQYITGLIYCFSYNSLYHWPAESNNLHYSVEKWQANELDELSDWPVCEYLFRERILKDDKAGYNSQLPGTSG